MFASTLEDHIAIVDKDNRRRIGHGHMEYGIDVVVKIFGPGYDGAIDQEELASQTSREGSTDCGLACPRRACQHHTALRCQPQFRSQL